MQDTLDLTLSQKAAAILAALGQERAAKILGHFEPEEIRALMVASKELNNVPQELLEILVEQFEGDFSSGIGLLNSSKTIQSIIEETLTPEQMEELRSGPQAVDLSLNTRSIWEIMNEVEDEALIEFLISENAQVAGYVLTRLDAKKSAAIVSLLDQGQRKDIVSGMISSRAPAAEALDMLEGLLKETFGRSAGMKKDNSGQRVIAGIFNELEQELSDQLFDELGDAVQAQKLQSLKSMMFRFEDISLLDNAARSTIFDQIPTELVTLALREAKPELTELILVSLGQRTRRMLEQELKTPTSATSDDIRAAQKEIASTVLNLASAGSLVIPEPELAA